MIPPWSVYGCIDVENFNKFSGTLQLGEGCLKLVSRHKELFRKWLAFQATPKKQRFCIFNETCGITITCVFKEADKQFPFPLTIACLLLFSLRLSGLVPATGIWICREEVARLRVNEILNNLYNIYNLEHSKFLSFLTHQVNLNGFLAHFSLGTPNTHTRACERARTHAHTQLQCKTVTFK